MNAPEWLSCGLVATAGTKVAHSEDSEFCLEVFMQASVSYVVQQLCLTEWSLYHPSSWGINPLSQLPAALCFHLMGSVPALLIAMKNFWRTVEIEMLGCK